MWPYIFYYGFYGIYFGLIALLAYRTLEIRREIDLKEITADPGFESAVVWHGL